MDSAIEISTTDAPAAPPATSRWQRIGAALERAGEWLNPLLVKECRQALKSRQFALTFALVLLLCWLWSIAGIARLGPEVAYRFDGPEMFYGYYMILAFPLLVIVPYSAFRSLIAEREENTFELVAITTLKPRQIAGGKLGSAVVQMLVYFSAVAPCLVFTYLLRGVDVLTICYILFYTFLGSVGLSLATLFLAAASKEKHWQIMIAVALVVGLFYAFIGAITLCHWILRWSRMSFHDAEFWISNLAILTGYASTFALLYLAAGAQLTFTADNRSTPLRIAMLVQHVLFAGWMGFVVVRLGIVHRDYDLIVGASVTYATAAMLYWYGMGAMMTGESPDLSPRVQRSLPKSFMGRMFLTWFNPGPGTGYMFALSNAAAAGLFGAIGVGWGYALGTSGGMGFPTIREVLVYFLLAISYLVVYLGCGNLLLRLLRPVANVTLTLALLLNGLLLLAGFGIPWIVRMSTDFYGSGYSLLHITDPFWSCYLAVESSSMPPIVYAIMWFVLPAAGLVFLLNLLYVVPEIRQVRVAKPQRVAEEDEALAAASAPAVRPQPTNPWDDDAVR